MSRVLHSIILKSKNDVIEKHLLIIKTKINVKPNRNIEFANVLF